MRVRTCCPSSQARACSSPTSATWRASRDWGGRLGYSPGRLAEANRRAVALVEELRDAAPDVDAVLNGVVGPRGDGSVVGETMTADEAEAYHGGQIGTFAGTPAEMVTMTSVDEALGIARAAQAAGLPSVISCTVETDGRLPRAGRCARRSSRSTPRPGRRPPTEGDPARLAADHRALRARLPKATVLGGCRGTDDRHVAAIAEAWVR